MALVVLGSAKGSPGATTLGVALAQSWPGLATVVECDLAGGDLAARFHLAPSPNLASLAARLGERSSDVWRGTRQVLTADAGAVVGGVGDWETGAGLDWPGLAGHLASTEELVLADVGRLGAGPFELLAPRAAAVLLVAHNELSSLSHVRGMQDWVAKVAPETTRGLVVVGGGTYSDQEVSATVGIEVFGRVDWVQGLAAPPKRSRPLDLKPLDRPVRRIVERLGELVVSGGPGAAPEVSRTWEPYSPPHPVQVEDSAELTAPGRPPRVVYGPGVRDRRNVHTKTADEETWERPDDDIDPAGELDPTERSTEEPGADEPARLANGTARRTVRPGQPGEPGLRQRTSTRGG